jgi:hypothetical protein
VWVILEWALAQERRPGHAGTLSLLHNGPPVRACGTYRLIPLGKGATSVTLAAELRPGCAVPFALAEETPAEREAMREAGHFAVALHFGRKVGHVSVAPGEGFLGRYCHGSVPDSISPHLAREHVLVALAGRVAEEIRFGAADLDGCGEDLRSARATALVLAGGDCGQLESLLLVLAEECREVLLGVWGRVELLAEVVLWEDELSGEEAARVYAGGR